nr:MAG TPA: hypothetical protein [Caudoviricetes sp.]
MGNHGQPRSGDTGGQARPCPPPGGQPPPAVIGGQPSDHSRLLTLHI